MFKTKAETLFNLQKKLKICKIPKTYYFSVFDWKKKRKKILGDIHKKFKGEIAIRSSAADEDSIKKSNAGKYLSFLNINSNNKKNITECINKIIKSYDTAIIFKSKILIQKMITTMNCSGVVFNRDLNTGAKYYVINYDDVSGKSNTVTSGVSRNSNRLLFAYHEKISDVNSKRFSKLLIVVKKIESLFKKIPLDIEFIISKKLEIYILQVRPLILKKRISLSNEKKISDNLKFLKKNISKKLKKNFTLFGQMPDWNPAEIIGKFPYPLCSSLYKRLVLDTSWIKGRQIMGYNSDFKNKNLMLVFLSQPFIDVRKSLISFLPSGINTKLKEKLLKFYLKKLKDNPNLHDKIEFDLAINCYLFDFENQFKKLSPNLLNTREIAFLKKSYKNMFTKNLSIRNKGSVDFNLKKVEKINTDFEKLKYENNIEKLIRHTIKNGIIPFSILARHAFIAENILRSLLRLKVLKNHEINRFKSSIRTITSEFINDCTLLSKNIIKFKFFIEKYGHLRPGSYDINSKSYSELPKGFFLKKKNFFLSKKKPSLNLTKSSKKNMHLILKKNHLPLDTRSLFNYIEKSIASREYSKFIFSKNLNLILKKIGEIAEQKRITKKKISFLKLDDIYKIYKKKLSKEQILNKIEFNKKEYEVNLNIKLPVLITDPKGTYVIPYQVSSPNFIGKQTIRGKITYIDSQSKLNSVSLNHKIILIENADPGFDWLFNFNIRGLITKFGGANSHMAIRCNELKVPAAIGVGEKIFEDLQNCEQLILNCSIKKFEKY